MQCPKCNKDSSDIGLENLQPGEAWCPFCGIEELEANLLMLLKALRKDPDPWSASASSVVRLLDAAIDRGASMSEEEFDILLQCKDQVKGLTGL